MNKELEKAFRENRGQLLALARRMVRSEADAEDVLQQAFENAVRHQGSFEGRSAVTSWLYRITHNTALMHLRSRRRKGAESLDAYPEEVKSALVHSARDDEFIEDPEDFLSRLGMRDVIANAMNALSDTDRKIVNMRLHEQRSTSEVAKAVGLSATATKTRLHRARAELRAQLGGELQLAA